MYNFLDLPHKKLSKDYDKENIYQLSESFIKDDINYVNDIYKVLESELKKDEDYFIVHERMLFKGKITKYIGNIVVSKKEDIITYIKKSIENNDLRPIRILPVKEPLWMIRFTEDSIMYIYYL